MAVTNGWGDSLMDLSVGGDLDAVIPVGTVPVY